MKTPDERCRFALPTGLMIDLLTNPEDETISNKQPRFSWFVQGFEEDSFQTAFQVLVSGSLEELYEDQGTMRDSGTPSPGDGWKTDDRSLHVLYQGRPLQPWNTYYWKVRIWTSAGAESPWSLPQKFTAGKLEEERPVDCRKLTTTEIEPASLIDLGNGKFFVDFGRAAFGTLRLTLFAGEKQDIEVHLAEVLDRDGRIERDPGGSRRYKRIRLNVDSGSKTYAIRIPPDARNTKAFAIHMPPDLFEVYPFRYCEIHSMEGPLQLSDIRQLAVHYPFDDSASHFRSSSNVLNDVWELCKYTMKAIHFNGESLEMYPEGLRSIVDWPVSERDDFYDRPVNSVVNAFHYRAVVLMERIARVVGNDEEAVAYARKAARIRDRFHSVFMDSSTGLVLDGEGSTHSSLHANMFALAFGLVPTGARAAVLKHIRSKGMACSVYGAQFLLEALYRAHDAEAALSLLTSTSERSWAHMINDVGTTIILEAWDDRFKPNQDWNHAWGAAPANIIPRNLMGVRPLSPGFGKILIQPQPGGLQWAELQTPTIRGPVFVRFENRPDCFFLETDSPGNTTTHVAPPSNGCGSTSVIVDGRSNHGILRDGFLWLNDLSPGRHNFIHVRPCKVAVS